MAKQPVPKVLFASPGARAGLPEEGRLLIPRHPEDRYGGAEVGRHHFAEEACTVSGPPGEYLGNGQGLAEPRGPNALVDVPEQGPGSIGGVGRVNGATRETVDEPAVNGAKGQGSGLCPGP